VFLKILTTNHLVIESEACRRRPQVNQSSSMPAILDCRVATLLAMTDTGEHNAQKILIANRGEIACRDAGVQGIYGPGSNIVECATDVLRLLGHNMPPVGE
jgi:hypothetical protein